LTKLTTDLCDEKIKSKANKLDTEPMMFETNDIPDTPNEFWRLSLNYQTKDKGLKKETEESEIYLKSVFRENYFDHIQPQSLKSRKSKPMRMGDVGLTYNSTISSKEEKFESFVLHSSPTIKRRHN